MKLESVKKLNSEEMKSYLESTPKFAPKEKDLLGATLFFSNPENLVDEREKALKYSINEINNLIVNDVVFLYQYIFENKDFTTAKFSLKLLYFAFSKAESDKVKILSILKNLIPLIQKPMLQSCANEMLLIMEGQSQEISGGLVRKISKDFYGAIFENGKLYLADKENSQYIEKELLDIKIPTSYEEDQKRLKAVNKISDLLFSSGAVDYNQLSVLGNMFGSDKEKKELYQNYLGYLDGLVDRVLIKEFNYNAKEFTLPEQFNFIYFLNNSNKEKFENVSKFSKKFNTVGLRTFLSIEHGGKEMGDKILTLGEKLPKEVAEKIFIKYGEIIDSSEEINNILLERFNKENTNKEIILKIKENLLKKGKDLLLESADSLNKCKEEDCEPIAKNIENKIDFISKESILLSSTFKELLKNENLQISDIKDVSMDMINRAEEVSKFKDELIRIFTNNRENYPEELLKETLAEFEEAINHIEGKELYILQNKQEILAFMRFDILENGNYYAGSLNGRNEIQGLAVGGSFLKQLLIEKSKERNIEAVVYENNQMLNRYVKEFGFEIIGEIENYKNTGQKFYKLEIQKDSLE